MTAILTAFWRFAHPRIVKNAAKVGFLELMSSKKAIFNAF